MNDSLQDFLFEHAVRDLATLKRTDKIENDPNGKDDWQGEWAAAGDTTIYPGDDEIMVHRGWSADDIMVLVGGGLAGGHSMFFPSWSRGRSSPFVTQEVHS